MNHQDDPLDVALRSVESFGKAPEVLRTLFDEVVVMSRPEYRKNDRTNWTINR